MKFQESKQKIFSFIDGELSSHEERTLYGQLSNSPSLMTEYNLAKDLDDLLEDAITHVDPPEDFAENVLKLISESENSEGNADITVPEATSHNKQFLKKEVLWRGWIGRAAGLALAVLLGISAFAANTLQLADNFGTDVENRHNQEIIMEPTVVPGNAVPEDGSQPDKTQNNPENENETSIPGQVVEDTANPLPFPEGEQGTGEGNAHSNQRDDTSKEGAQEKDTMIAFENNSGKQHNVLREQAPSEGEEQPSSENTESGNSDGTFVVMGHNPTNNITTDKVFETLSNISQPLWTASGEVIFAAQGEKGYTWYKGNLDTEKINKLVGPLKVAGKWSLAVNKVAFTAPDADGISCIWTADSSGNIENMTPADAESASGDKNNGRWAFNPVWSPRGEIAYLTERFGDVDIMVVDARGNARRLTTSREKESYPVWSPDGQKIAYYRYWYDKKTGKQVGQVYVQNADGSNLQAVTPLVGSQSMVPAWSPDGKLLAINVAGDVNGIWQTGIDNSNWKQLREEGAGQVISWSPDGQSIAFNDSEGKMHVLRRKTARQEAQLLSIPIEGLPQSLQVSWSPDANELLFEMVNPETSQSEILRATLPKAVSAY